MTSDNASPIRLTKVDKLMRPQHHHLREEDKCCFIREYTAGERYTFSPTNDLISNFKKDMDRHDKLEWRYKGIASRRLPKPLGKP